MISFIYTNMYVIIYVHFIFNHSWDDDLHFKSEISTEHVWPRLRQHPQFDDDVL